MSRMEPQGAVNGSASGVPSPSSFNPEATGYFTLSITSHRKRKKPVCNFTRRWPRRRRRRHGRSRREVSLSLAPANCVGGKQV